MQTKNKLRDEARKRLRSLPPDVLSEKSRIIQQKLLALELFKKAGCILFYVALPTEVDTRHAIEESLRLGKSVAVPLAESGNKKLTLYSIKNLSELRSGYHGVLEPVARPEKEVSCATLDLVVVPGVAFDKSGGRLGRGAGFYDRFLAQLEESVPKIGLSFAEQIVPELPHEAHDVRMDFILTD